MDREGHRGDTPSQTSPEEGTAFDEPLILLVATPGLRVIAPAPYSGHCGTPSPGGLRDPAQSATRPPPGWPRTRCTPLTASPTVLLKGLRCVCPFPGRDPTPQPL